MKDGVRTRTNHLGLSAEVVQLPRSLWLSESGCVLVVVMACLVVSYAQWARIPWLTDNDWVRWLFEASRFAAGETPYRDFMWPYPPLSIYLFGSAFALFGSSFGVANALLCLTGTSVAIATYAAAREIYGRHAGLGLALALVFFASHSGYDFALFSLDMYSPAISLGCVGIALCSLALARAHRRAPGDWQTLAISYIGFALAALSKPESALGAAILVAATAAVRERRRVGSRGVDLAVRVVAAIVGASIVPVALYAALGASVGHARLIAGVTGYSVGSGFCPWWPTGFGLSVALSAACIGFAVAGMLAWAMRLVPPGRRSLVPFLIIVGLPAWTACLLQMSFLFPQARTFLDVAAAGLGSFLSLQGIMLPLLWSGIIVIAQLVVQSWRVWFRTSKGEACDLELLALLSASVAVSVRGLFNHLFGDAPMVVPSAYPLLILAAPALGLHLVRAVTGSALKAREVNRIVVFGVVVLLSLGTVRMSLGVVKGIRTPTYRIETAAGTVYVRDGGRSILLIDAVRRNLEDGQSILEIPFGGGMNFCFQRLSPAYCTQFTGFKPNEEILLEDLDRVRKNPPALVVARDAPHLGAVYGVPWRSGCCFPDLRWVPDVPTWSDRSIPAVAWIEENYVRVEKVGDFWLLKRNS